AAALDAPTALTINAKGLLPPGHPLLLGSNQSLLPVRELALQADVVLAIGTELGETDYDVVFDGNFKLGGELIRIDIDPQQLMRNHAPSIAIHSDARSAMRGLLELLPTRSAKPDSPGAQRTAAVQAQLAEGFSGWTHYRALFDPILETPPDARFAGDSTQTVDSGNHPDEVDGARRWLNAATGYRTLRSLFDSTLEALPDARLVGDSTQTVYGGHHLVELDGARRWFTAATGYGTLGYGLPAAIGAKLAEPSRPVISLMGDGGIQFTLP